MASLPMRTDKQTDNRRCAMEGLCYIIGAGPVEDLIFEPSEKDFVIAADAGYLHMTRLSAVADLVVGDFDSLPQKPNHPNVVVHPKEKDQTDMLLAIDEGLRRDYKEFIILGGLGGRLDHSYANIQALSYIAQKNARGYLLGNGTAVTVIKNGCIAFDSENKGIVSVFCCGGTAKGVTLKGLKYPLNNAVLKDSYPIGVSNEFTGVKSEITVSNGSLIIIWEESTGDFIDNLKETCCHML
jgi:thiamine pyrophosphokinase